MSTSERQIECTIPILPVSDLVRSIDFYTHTLGFKLEWNAGTICSVSRDRGGIMLSETANSDARVWTGVRSYAVFHVFRDKGVKIRQEPRNWSWAYEMKFEELDGNVLWLGTEPRDDLPKEDVDASSSAESTQ